MKRIWIIVICLIGMLNVSACRSTSDPCGLAEYHSNTEFSLKSDSINTIDA